MALEFNEGYVHDIIEIKERSKSNSHRLDDVEVAVKKLEDKNETLYEISANMKTLTEGVVNIKDDVKAIKSEQGEMKSQISDLSNSPNKVKAQWMDKAIGAIIGAVGSAVLFYILNAAFPVLFK